MSLGGEFIRSNVDVYLLLFQVVDITDVGHTLALDTSFSFGAPTSLTGTTLSGKDLVSNDISGRVPLFGNLLRVDVSRWRNGFNSIDLPAVSTKVKGGKEACSLRLSNSLCSQPFTFIFDCDGYASGATSVPSFVETIGQKEANREPSPNCGEAIQCTAAWKQRRESCQEGH